MPDTKPLRLGINIDHIATLRQQRGTPYPDVIAAAQLAVASGADLITVHLREDKRHIQPDDVIRLRAQLGCPLNLEMALTDDMLGFAVKHQPDWVCLVPEKREELTTEGGLDAVQFEAQLQTACRLLATANCKVSLFIDPDIQQLECAGRLGVDAVELHTGTYADSNGEQQHKELLRLEEAAAYGAQLGLQIHAGHGLTTENVQAIAAIAAVEELNIGHSIVTDAVFSGLPAAIASMRMAMRIEY